jgi:hypothetical protein
MKWIKTLLPALLILAAALPAAALPGNCPLNFISHGTFRDSGGCLLFEDDLGNLYEVVNPRGVWQDGMTGTVYGHFAEENACSSETPIGICLFDADYTRTVTGTLEFVNFVECPGFVIAVGETNYLILNCEDFDNHLCNSGNLGRRIRAEVFVDTGVSICLGMNRSTVLEYWFLD